VSLFWRVFLISASLLIAGVAVLVLSPATVSARTTVGEAALLAAGAGAVLVANFVLMRRAFRSLERLTMLMRRVDPQRPGQRVEVIGDLPEVAELSAAFNEMLDRLEGERRESSRRAIAAQERERRRLSLELHDEVGQTLTGVVLQLGSASDLASEELRQRLLEAQETAREGVEAVREITRGLRPEALDDFGLRTALVTLASSFADRSQIPVRRRITNDLPKLSREDELVIYRIAQESLTNVARHADATQVELSLHDAGDTLQLRICDDGRGIHDQATGAGLEGMRERARLAGGVLEIRAGAAGRGTDVYLHLPLRGSR
jgi:two-component system sensor histidine kinase UhpB